MRGGFRIARLFGIDVYIDWSLIFIFFLIIWNLAAAVFPSLHPEWGSGLDLAVAIIAAVLFFASVLAHEVAHSVVANARGLPVNRITLFILGGVSDIEREPTSAGTEFLMAFVGPLTSIILGVIFLLIGGMGVRGSAISLTNPVQSLKGLGPIDTLLLWLGPVNIVLGLFNLVPAFPLDGGRVLRSIFWAATQNLRKATKWASVVSQIIAWVFITAGIAMVFGIQIPFFGTGVVSGLWLAFIGWFVNSGAVQSYQQVVIEDILHGIPISRLMRSSTQGVSQTISISDLVDHYILGTDDRAFPVVENDQIVGLVSVEDVRKVPRKDWESTPVSAIMTPVSQLEMATPGEDASQVFNKLAHKNVGQIPVVDDGHLVGLVRRQDIVRYLQLNSRMAGLS